MNDIDKLKVDAYDILAQIEAHTQKIQLLKEQLININDLIKQEYEKSTDS